MNDHTRDIYSNMATLARIVREFEARVFGDNLSQVQRDILFACVSLSDGNAEGTVHSDDIKRSPFCARISQPTYNRALKRLVADGYIKKNSGRSGEYKLGELQDVDLSYDGEKTQELTASSMLPAFGA